MIEKARELLESGAVNAVLGWQKGELPYDAAPMLFRDAAALENMVYSCFCGSNLSKYLVEQGQKDGKTLVFLKPCDTYSLNQLIGENRVNRENIYAIGIGCGGMVDIEKLRAQGVKGILSVEQDGENLEIRTMYGDDTYLLAGMLFEKCLHCKGKDHMIFDEIICPELSKETSEGDKFAKVAELEEMDSDARFAFWRGALSKCIRCNACRNACPACTCIKCVFDNPHSGVGAKVNATDFEENMFHIIRAFHVAGRCSDCGECTRVCPQGVPLHLLNCKFIKDMNTFYGEYQAGETAELNSPLLRFDFDDAEPSVISQKGGS